MDKRRITFAFLGAPLSVPFVFLFLFLVHFPGRGDGTPGGGVLEVLVGVLYSIYALPIAYIAELLCGAPAWMTFQRYRIRSWSAFALVGALIGWLVNLGMETVVGSGRLPVLFNPLANPYLCICVVAASGSALLFRAIVFWGHPST